MMANAHAYTQFNAAESIEMKRGTALRPYVVVGLGVTGLSCVRYLLRMGCSVRVTDSRVAPPGLNELISNFAEVPYRVGGLDHEWLCHAEAVVVSPGVPLDDAAIIAARTADIEVIGDIELFARAVSAPVIAITGSNGKSTVVSLVQAMLAADGIQVEAGANLGVPALDLLEKSPACYVLELSSFQLESTYSLNPTIGCILNISADHLDRHGTIEAYTAAKARILNGAQHIVTNFDDEDIAKLTVGTSVSSFSLRSDRADYHLATKNGAKYLCQGEERILARSSLRLVGDHNVANALAALAITDRMSVSRAVQKQVLSTFEGLAHRLQRIAEHADVVWYNDSKGTNVGASCAAINGLFAECSGVVIAGGQAKGADFEPLAKALAGRVHTVIVFGEDAALITMAIKDVVEVVSADDLASAVARANSLVRAGQAVLFSPACASFDMFKNFEDRGIAFVAAVKEILCQ